MRMYESCSVEEKLATDAIFDALTPNGICVEK
jgi:hypothetical protein